MSANDLPPAPDAHDPTTRLGDAGDTTTRLARASKLLRLGASGAQRPVDDLVERLRRSDGPQWLPRALDGAALAVVGAQASDLAAGGLDLGALRSIKEASKRIAGSAASEEERLAGLAGYFLAIAAGLRHHATLIGGPGRREVDEALLDLAEAAPPPFADLLCAATLVDEGGEQ